MVHEDLYTGIDYPNIASTTATERDLPVMVKTNDPGWSSRGHLLTWC